MTFIPKTRAEAQGHDYGDGTLRQQPFRPDRCAAGCVTYSGN